MPAGDNCMSDESFSSGSVLVKLFGSIYFNPALSTLSSDWEKLKVWNVQSAIPNFQSFAGFTDWAETTKNSAKQASVVIDLFICLFYRSAISLNSVGYFKKRGERLNN